MTATAVVVNGAFNAEQLEERKKTLGASEIPAVAGLSPYQSALDVFLVKRGIVPSFAGNEYTKWGNRLESVIAEEYAAMHGVDILPAHTTVSVIEPWASATPDRIISSPEGLRGLEVKNRGLWTADGFGESGSDKVPHDVAAQCHWSMFVTGLTTWDVAVLIGGNEFRWFRLYFDAEIVAALLERGRDFWFNNVQKGIAPAVDGTDAYTEYLKAKFVSHTEHVMDATPEQDEWIRDLVDVRAQADAIEKRKKLLENQLKAAIGDAAGILSPAAKVTWKAPQPTTMVNWEAIGNIYLAGLAAEKRAELLQEHTSEKANSRRFLVSLPKVSK